MKLKITTIILAIIAVTVIGADKYQPNVAQALIIAPNSCVDNVTQQYQSNLQSLQSVFNNKENQLLNEVERLKEQLERAYDNYDDLKDELNSDKKDLQQQYQQDINQCYNTGQCGNNICEGGETKWNCPADCQITGGGTPSCKAPLIDDNVATLRWDPVSTAEYYIVGIWHKGKKYLEKQVTGTSYNVVLPEGTYYTRTRAPIVAGGSGEWCNDEAVKFVIEDEISGTNGGDGGSTGTSGGDGGSTGTDGGDGGSTGADGGNGERPCNNNGVCDLNGKLGEDHNSCAADCPLRKYCNDGICRFSELKGYKGYCAEDCGS
jgi:gas vesicle protein